MLNTFMPRLIKELDLGDAKLETTQGTYSLPLGEGYDITLSTIDNGFMLKCLVSPLPKEEEAFIDQVMQGNLFGKETHDAVLGLTFDGTTLTLTHVIDYQVDYKNFKDILEDFINTADFWREKIIR